MPKIQRIRRIEGSNQRDNLAMKRTLESYMKGSTCLVCRENIQSDLGICEKCMAHADRSLFDLYSRINNAEAKAVSLEKICRSCAGLPWGDDVSCNSKDCPVFYSRTRHMSILRSTKASSQPIIQLLEGDEAQTYDW